jgi:hypothetical protein
MNGAELAMCLLRQALEDLDGATADLSLAAMLLAQEPLGTDVGVLAGGGGEGGGGGGGGDRAAGVGAGVTRGRLAPCLDRETDSASGASGDHGDARGSAA